MAYLGAIGVGMNQPGTSNVRSWRGPVKSMSAADDNPYPFVPANLNGKYAWIVTQNGTPVAGHLVGIYYRGNGKLVKTAVSDSTGYFEFTGLIPNQAIYFICALDKDGAPFQNAIIYDYISAVPV